MSESNADTGEVHLQREGVVATLTFDRPQARNAMTWAMYESLVAHLRAIHVDNTLRVVMLRGAGGEAFVAGTDIAQFQAFRAGGEGGDDGVAYEQQIDACVELLSGLPQCTVAVVEGWCVGGGLALATACDFRLATPRARFGVPIARTLGNCLSMANLARLQAAWGSQRLRRMLLLAEFIMADEARSCDFLHAVVEPADIGKAAHELAGQLASLAPVTQRVSKEGLRRLALRALPEGEDLIRAAYGSADFREGVAAFVARRPPQWSGK